MLKTKLKLGRAELNHKIKYKQVINQMKSCWPQGPLNSLQWSFSSWIKFKNAGPAQVEKLSDAGVRHELSSIGYSLLNWSRMVD